MKNPPVLVLYDLNASITLSDASSKAVGAVLMQHNRPVAYATQALTAAQQNYPQIKKEAYAIRFGCKPLNAYVFHEYVYGK